MGGVSNPSKPPVFTPAQRLGSAGLYGGVSLTLFLALKTVISSFSFTARFSLLGGQLLFGVALCLVLKKYHWLLPKGMSIPEVNWATFKRALPVGALFMANNASAFVGIRMVPAPMFLAVRRTAIGLIMLTEWAVLGKAPSLAVMGSIAVVVAGTVMAGYENLEGDASGYAFILFSNALASLSLVYARKFSDDTGVRGMGMVLYTGLTGAPLGLLAAALVGEPAYIAQYPSLGSPGFLLAMLVFAVLGTAMNYSQNLCAAYNSPLVASIVGVLKDILSTLVSAVVFTGFNASPLAVLGLVVSFVGALAFAFVKLQEAQFSGVVGAKREAHTPPTARGDTWGATSPCVSPDHSLSALRERPGSGPGVDAAHPPSSAPAPPLHTAPGRLDDLGPVSPFLASAAVHVPVDLPLPPTSREPGTESGAVPDNKAAAQAARVHVRLDTSPAATGQM